MCEWPNRSRTWRNAPRFALLVTLVLAQGCSSFDWRRSLYDIRDQHACQQQNEARHGEGGAVIACGDASHPDRTDYDDYQSRRAVTAESKP